MWEFIAVPAHAKKLVVLFVTWFVPLTALDLGITWYGEHYVSSPDRRCCHELNPFTDFSSIPNFVARDIVVLMLGIALVAAGGWTRALAFTRSGGRVSDLRGLPFRVFMKRYEKVGGRLARLAIVLIVVPMVIAIGRIYPVVNNVMYIVIDWEPNSLFGGLFGLMSGPIVCGLSVFPMYYMVRRYTLVD